MNEAMPVATADRASDPCAGTHADASASALVDALGGVLAGEAPGVASGAGSPGPRRGPRIDIDPNDVRKGLGQLVLTVVRLLHELMERQAIRRMKVGSLTDTQIEDLGRTLAAQEVEIKRLAEHFGLRESDLNLDLGPLGRVFDDRRAG